MIIQSHENLCPGQESPPEADPPLAENLYFKLTVALSVMCPGQESNLRPLGPQPNALSTELPGRGPYTIRKTAIRQLPNKSYILNKRPKASSVASDSLYKSSLR